MTRRFSLVVVAVASVALGGCSSSGELVVQDGVGISAVRSACPAVGIPDYTGDVTLFTDGAAHDSRSIDVVAAITNVRGSCDPGAVKVTKAAMVKAGVSFVVQAHRTDTRGDRDVALPYFVTVMRGSNEVVAKRVGLVSVHFADGQSRAEVVARGSALIDKADATLARTIHDRITRKRKAGSADAAVDPLSDPDVRDAVDRASFELLVGFQLDDSQLAYNATR